MASEDEHATFRAINNMRFHLGQLRDLLSGVTVTNAGALFSVRTVWRRRLVRGERLFSIIDREYCQGLSARPPRQQYRSWEVRATLVECRAGLPPLPDISADLDAHLAASTSSRWQRALVATAGSG